MSDKPLLMRRRPFMPARRLAEIETFYREYLATLQAVDEMVDSIYAMLEASGAAANTYVFFTSDNGMMLGEHRMLAKNIHYERAIRVPLLVTGPGVPHGAVRDEPVLNIDLAPTFAQIANASLRSTPDGRSLVPLLTGGAAAWRSDFLVENEIELDGEPLRVQAVRTPDFFYAVWTTGERELYDLRADPHQLQNVAGSGHVAEPGLDARLDQLRGCRGAGCD